MKILSKGLNRCTTEGGICLLPISSFMTSKRDQNPGTRKQKEGTPNSHISQVKLIHCNLRRVKCIQLYDYHRDTEYLHYFLLCFEMESPSVHRLSLSLCQSSCLSFPGARVLGMNSHVWLLHSLGKGQLRNIASSFRPLWLFFFLSVPNVGPRPWAC